MIKTKNLLLILLIILFFSCTNDTKQHKKPIKQLTLKTYQDKPLILSYKVGSKIPKFSDIIINDERVKNKIIFIDFWATWCAPCKETIPFLAALQKQYPDDLAIIGVMLENRSLDSISGFIKKYGVNYIISDAGGEGGNFAMTEVVGGIRGLPTLFVYDEQGQYARHFRGQVAEHYINDALKQLVLKKHKAKKQQ